MDLTDKVAIVTGASAGIGASLVRRLLARGARVVLAARRENRMKALVEQLEAGSRTLAVRTDVTIQAHRERLVRRTLETFGQVDLLVNNAGMGLSGRLVDADADVLDRLVQVNLLAPMQLTRLALPHLLERPEAMVVDLSSMSALTHLPFQSAYTATKGGLRAFDRSLRRELRDTGVRVMTVYPGVTDTEMIHHMKARADEVGVDVPIHSPESVADAVLDGIARGRREVIAGGAQDRLVAALDRWVPRLFDLLIDRARPTLEDIASAHRTDEGDPDEGDPDEGEPDEGC